MSPLSIPDLDNLRALAFENAHELLEDAGFLFSNKRYARTYTLAHLASEELAKLPTLALAATDIAHGVEVNWESLDKQLRSHSNKLKGLLFLDFLGTNVDPTAKEITVLDRKISRVELFNDLKNVSLYSGIYLDSMYKPSAVIKEELAVKALVSAKNRLQTFSAVEAATRGKIEELAANPSYKKLLNELGVHRYD